MVYFATGEPMRGEPPVSAGTGPADRADGQAAGYEAGTGVLTMGLDGVLRDLNPAAERLFGYSRGEAVGAKVGDLIVPERLRAAHEEALCRLRANGGGRLFETHLELVGVRKGGEEIGVDLLLTTGPDATVIGIARQLPCPPTVRSRADVVPLLPFGKRARVDAARLDTLIDSLAVGVLVQDVRRRVVLTNGSWVEMFGLGVHPDKLRGESLAPFISLLADADAATRRFDEIIADGRPVRGEAVPLADGRVFERDYSPITLDGVTHGHVWLWRDVTAETELRRGLEERNRTLSDLAALRSQFVAVVSHELRTPLTSIATFTEMLDDGTALAEEEHAAAVAAIRRNAERMLTLVADLITLAKLESGELALTAEPVDMGAVLGEAVRKAPPGVKLAANIGTGPPVLGDSELLTQFATIIVSVTVSASTADADVSVRGDGTADGWTVEVTTSAADAGTAERLLATRLTPTGIADEQRTAALGLMLARAIVNRHGGELSVRAEPPGVRLLATLPSS
jgi:PAS domain S-box-containing protein